MQYSEAWRKLKKITNPCKKKKRMNKGLEEGRMNRIMRKREMSPLRMEAERERVGLIWRHAEQGN